VAKEIVGVDGQSSYSFDPALHQVGIYGLPAFQLEQLVLIINVTRGIILYNFASETLGGTLVGNLLTLEYDTAAMDSADRLQIIVDLPTAQFPMVDVKDRGLSESMQTGMGSGLAAVETFDPNMMNVLGSQPLTYLGRLNTWLKFQDKVNSQQLLYGTNTEFSVDCSASATVALQVAGTWAGTLTFEATSDGGNWVAVSGVPSAGTAAVATTTGSGMWRFASAGLARIRVRRSTATSGSPFVTFVVSALEMTLPTAVQGVNGSQTQLLNQRASTYELNTYDTNMATVMGAINMVRPIYDNAVAQAAPALPATYVSRSWSTWPQYYPRLRVEAGGDQKLPFAQQPNSNELKVAYPDMLRLFETMIMQLALLNQANINQGLVQPPIGWEEVR